LACGATPSDRPDRGCCIAGGQDHKGIDLQGKHHLRISGNLAAVQVCGWSSLASYDSGQAGASLHGSGFYAGG
jgi:hypothetical protein